MTRSYQGVASYARASCVNGAHARGPRESANDPEPEARGTVRAAYLMIGEHVPSAPHERFVQQPLGFVRQSEPFVMHAPPPSPPAVPPSGGG